jgi:hypothetical protein
MSDSIILDKERGVNAHVTVCEMCGKDYGVALMGTSDWIAICPSCNSKNLVTQRHGRCLKCGSWLLGKKTRLAEAESIIMGICVDCEKRQRNSSTRLAEVVYSGSVKTAILTECSKPDPNTPRRFVSRPGLNLQILWALTSPAKTVLLVQAS